MLAAAGQNTSFIDVLDKIRKYSIYTLAFLLPLFFLPGLSDGVDVNKQAVLALLACAVLFSWMVKTMISGTLQIQLNKVHITVAVLLVVYAVATFFSVSGAESFWGWPQVISSSFVSILCFCAIYFVVANTFSETEIFTSVIFLAGAMALAEAYGIMQLLGLHILPFGFANNNDFNTIGSIGSLGLLSVALLPLWMALLAVAKPRVKILLISNIVLAFVVAILVNYAIIWIVCLFGALLAVGAWFMRRDVFDGRLMFLPMFFLIVSLFFIIIRPQIPWLPAKPLEISISQKSTVEITLNTLKKYPLFGSGPSTFMYDFAAFRNANFNKGTLWNVEFSAGASKALTDVATTGVLGAVAFVAMAALALFYAAKTAMGEYRAKLSSKVKSEEASLKTVLLLGISAVLGAQLLGYFLYNSNVVLGFTWFFATGALVALVFGARQKYVLKSSSIALLLVTFIFTSLLIFGAGLLMVGGQRYYAGLAYQQASNAYAAGDSAKAITLMKTAISNNKTSDFYYRQLSLFSIALFRQKISQSGTTPTAEEKNAVAAFISDAIASANMAVTLNPKNPANWSSKGLICQNLVGFNPDAVTCAISSYDKAAELYPTSPSVPFQQANTYLAEAIELVGGKSSSQVVALQSQKSSILKNAIAKYQEAIVLKEDYVEAYMRLSLAQKGDNDATGAVTSLEKAVSYSQQDANLLLQIGDMYYQNKDWQKAQMVFQRALVLVPDYANILYYSGLAYEKQGKITDAIAQFTKILEKNPNSIEVQKIIANLKAGRPALDGLSQQPIPTNEPAAPKVPGPSQPKQ